MSNLRISSFVGCQSVGVSCIPAEKSGHLSSSPTHGTCPRHPPEHSDAPRWMIYPTQQVKRPGAKVGLASPRAASLLWGGSAASDGDILGGTCSARTTLDAMRPPPGAVGELIYELQHIDRRRPDS